MEKVYGVNKISYKVIEKNDHIELHVCHQNQDVIHLLEIHKNDPVYFLHHCASYKESSIRAKFHLSKVIEDYKDYFGENRVKIIFTNDKLIVKTISNKPNLYLDDVINQSLNTAKTNFQSSTDIFDSPDSLWDSVLANPVPLFLTASDNELLAVFDKKGFFLSKEAQAIYNKIKSLPHIYVARLESENAYYFGISNQRGGRWKRSHAYHLGGLAYEILGTKRDYDQDHSNWILHWFEQPLEIKHCGSKYCVRMKKRVVISFFVPEPEISKSKLEEIESALINLATKKGVILLNKRI